MWYIPIFMFFLGFQVWIGAIYFWADYPSKDMEKLLALLDGAVDEPSPSLSYKTPLEAARKPFMDRLTSSGLTAHTGIHIHTHEFLASLLIAEGRVVARGILEAIALDIPLKGGRPFIG